MRISRVFATDLYAYIMCICYWFIPAYHVYLLLIYKRMSGVITMEFYAFSRVFATDVFENIVCFYCWFISESISIYY